MIHKFIIVGHHLTGSAKIFSSCDGSIEIECSNFIDGVSNKIKTKLTVEEANALAGFISQVTFGREEV